MKFRGCNEQKQLEKINAKYAEIVVRGISEAPYFEILYFDLLDNGWHVGFGSFYLDLVEKWLKEEFHPTYMRIDTAITALMNRAEEAEARAEKAEKQLNDLLMEKERALFDPFKTTRKE